jgi:hypothetical protein
MTMSLSQPETQALGTIADGLAGSDPRLTSMLTIFSRLAAGEEMPARDKTRARRGRPAGHRPRRTRRHPRRGIAFPQARRRCARLGWPPGMLVRGAVISAGLLTAALVLTASVPTTCARPMGTACPSSSIPQRADSGLSRRYGGKRAAGGLDFVVRPGVVTGFLGLNGAGLPVTMRMIAGLDAPTAGRVRVNGRDYRAAPAPVAGLGIVLEAKAMRTGRPARDHLPRFGARSRQRIRSLV